MVSEWEKNQGKKFARYNLNAIQTKGFKISLHVRNGIVLKPVFGSFSVQCRTWSESKVLMTKNWKKIAPVKFFISIKNCNLLFPRPP